MTNRIVAALIAALFAASSPPALADVIPPPDQVTPVQSRMIGTWQQTGQIQLRDHGQGRDTFIFDATHYIRASIHVIGNDEASATYVESGTWTGKDLGGNVYELTLTPTGSAGEPLNATFSDERTMMLQLWPHSTNIVAPFAKVFP